MNKDKLKQTADILYLQLSPLIHKGEGTTDEQARAKGLKSGYDVAFQYGRYARPPKPISQMTIGELKEFQRKQVNATKGKVPNTTLGTSAVGRWQLMKPTLLDVQRTMGFPDSAIFSPALQDKIGRFLMERRGLDKYAEAVLSGNEYEIKTAGNEFHEGMANEWASVQKPSTGKSAHNQPSPTSVASIRAAMQVELPKEEEEAAIADFSPSILPEEEYFEELEAARELEIPYEGLESLSEADSVPDASFLDSYRNMGVAVPSGPLSLLRDYLPEEDPEDYLLYEEEMNGMGDHPSRSEWEEENRREYGTPKRLGNWPLPTKKEIKKLSKPDPVPTKKELKELAKRDAVPPVRGKEKYESLGTPLHINDLLMGRQRYRKEKYGD